MPESVIAALIQTPFVLAMVYVMQRFLTSMDARDKEWQEFAHEMRDSMAEITRAVRELSEVIIRHEMEEAGQPKLQVRQGRRHAASPLPFDRRRACHIMALCHPMETSHVH